MSRARKLERYLCHRTKAEGAVRDFGGQIFAAQSRKKDGSTRRWVAKVAKSAEFSREHPHLLVRDMAKGGAYRKIDLSKIDWIANRHKEIYFIGDSGAKKE